MKSSGFTIIELMVTIAIVGISLSLAVPGFSYLIDRNKMISSSNVVVGAFNLARVEATKRGTSINISSIDDSEAGNTWGNGYGIWLDADGDNAYDVGEEIRQFDAMADNLSLTDAVTSFSFQATGFSAAAGSLELCSSNSDVGGRQISISLSGRIRSSEIACP